MRLKIEFAAALERDGSKAIQLQLIFLKLALIGKLFRWQ